MDFRAQSHPISMIITTGDNVYPNTSGKFDKDFYTLMRIFGIGAIETKPWYAVLGNHDCYNNVDYQF